MISTPAAFNHHHNHPPHKLSQSLHVPFRDHAHLRRQSHSNSVLSPQYRHPAVNKHSSHGIDEAGVGHYRQGFYAEHKLAPKPIQKQLGIETPEHMLRRKTPNGTLKAGYDGTPVEWASRPPAHKQQVRSRPREDDPEAALRRQICVLLSDSSSPTSGQYADFQGAEKFGSYGQAEHAAKQVLNMRQISQSAGLAQPMDSLLYQAPSQCRFPASGYETVPIAMHPTWPRNIEPTASGPLMPCGPYWPNGTFEPYRPAAIRDNRFQTQFAQINLNDTADMEPWTRQMVELKRAPFRDSIYLGPATMGAPSKLENHLPLTLPHPMLQFQQQQQQQQRQQQQQQQQQLSRYNDGPYYDDSMAGNAGGYATQPASHFVGSSMNPDSMFSGQGFRRVNSSVDSSLEHFNLNMNGNMRPQLQFKEMALAQAHRTYIALLAAIQQSRKNSQSPGNKSAHRNFPSGSFFPRPPRNSVALENSSLRSNFEKLQRPVQRSLSYPTPGRTSLGAGDALAGSIQSAVQDAQEALDLLRQLARQSGWTWVDAMLLGGCLAYGLNDLPEAIEWFQRVLQKDINNIEAMSNLAAAFMTAQRRTEAEVLWSQVVASRPSYFEAVEHLVGMLCCDQRVAHAITVITYVEDSLREKDHASGRAAALGSKAGQSFLGGVSNSYISVPRSGYHTHPSEIGRLIALIHAKGNMLYASGNISAAAQAFEEAIMIAVGRVVQGIGGLIQRILACFATEIRRLKLDDKPLSPWDAVLLLPKMATQTARLAFANSTPLPGLTEISEGAPRRAAVAVTSNCLLSLAKIYQDSMSSGSTALGPPSGASGVQDILALYYLSLSLQPSPSTANNVGILLAGVQQPPPSRLPPHLTDPELPELAGVIPGSGIALALAYYNYGLHLDKEHAHLYTNLGSLLKDLGHLDLAIKMYEQAVRCDGKFDIALANLANAVKDRGRISHAIEYYKRAVDANGDFAEAVCGLANALNSVCGWTGRGGMVFGNRRFDRWHVNDEGMLVDARDSPSTGFGWIGRVVAIVNKQLADGRSWGKAVLSDHNLQALVTTLAVHDEKAAKRYLEMLKGWSGQDYEGARLVRWIERATRRLSWQWYQDQYVRKQARSIEAYRRPQLPTGLSIPNAPTVLPFHTFTCPLSASQIRQISQRNGLRISASTLKAPWLPALVFRPPPPPKPRLNIGYVSSDFNNHPLAHLMQSVFGMHDASKFKAFCYATTPSDKSSHRQKIEREAPQFYDASSWPVDKLVSRIVEDEIHILVNLNGYTRGARNEVFAARPAPIQMSFMGFAGTLGAEWCDYLLADEIAIPPSTLRPYRNNVTADDLASDENFGDKHNDWVYGENIIYTRDTFFCCDHRQSAPDASGKQLGWTEELERRRAMRKELFPALKDDVVIMGNFNQLYKIEPTTFRTWLRILQAVPKAILWLLRFPDLGETNLRAMAEKWTTPDVSSRVHFTDVAPKNQHIARARVCDIFLDTPECNAHTTAADVLWSGTPLLTYPRYEFKMCSRMAASILKGAMPRGELGSKAAKELTVANDEEYEVKAVELVSGLAEVLAGRRESCRILEIRKLIYEGRWSSPLFDTRRWTDDLEKAYEMAWAKWEKGEGGDIWL